MTKLQARFRIGWVGAIYADDLMRDSYLLAEPTDCVETNVHVQQRQQLADACRAGNRLLTPAGSADVGESVGCFLETLEWIAVWMTAVAVNLTQLGAFNAHDNQINRVKGVVKQDGAPER